MIRILLVEDEPIIAQDLACAVGELGYAVTGICRNHHEALAALAPGGTALPDLVLCDIHLDGDDWDGIQLAQEIRRLYHLPIIFLTALSDPATISRAAAAEPDAYLTKPFQERSLYAAIELAISRFLARLENKPPLPELDLSASLPFIGGHFFIKDKKRLVKVSAGDIRWIKADGVYSLLATATRQYLLSAHLGAIEDKLKGLPFVRVHRSWLVHFDHIEAIEEDQITVGLERIPLGKSYREAFYGRLRQL